jgi:hypothetical protein
MSRSTFKLLRARLLAVAGVGDHSVPPVEDLRRSEWSEEFERLMRNRLIQGAYRYRTLQQRREGSGRCDNIGSAIRRLRLYLKDGNLEHLVDAANLCLVEFEVPCCHSSPALRAVDDGEHVEEL